MNWYFTVLKKYLVFSGRARRKEFWYFQLISLFFILLLTFIESAITAKVFDPESAMAVKVYCVGMFLPAIGVTVRRLHDTGRSGWWSLIGIIPIVGLLVLAIFLLLDSQAGKNSYGPNPKFD